MYKKKKHKFNIAIVFFSIVLAVCIIFAAITIWNELHPELEYRDMQAKYTEEIDDNVLAISSDEDPYLTRSIDFASLQAINPEIIGWICIPDTPIDYPICRNIEDENYYLTHDSEKKESINGAIFILPDTSFSDTSLIIYGHNMRAGIMFGMLRHYEDDDFFSEHPYVYIYTPDENRKTEVFYSGEVDANGDAYLTGWSIGTEQYGDWINENFPTKDVANLSHEVTMYDHIYILSTCVSSNANHRYIVTSVVRDVLHLS